jgi:hypothetical protein
MGRLKSEKGPLAEFSIEPLFFKKPHHWSAVDWRFTLFLKISAEKRSEKGL